MIFLVVGILLVLGFAATAKATTGKRKNRTVDFTPEFEAPRIPDRETQVDRLAKAIAHAEGFFQAGSLPARANNPGDLKLGDRGHGTLQGKTIFATAEDGWNALKNQIRLAVSGKSKFYSMRMTIRQMAMTWTGYDQPETWAQNVSSHLGVSPETTLGSILGA